MRFTLSDDQLHLATTVREVLSSLDIARAARAWGEGEPGRGLDVWRKLADVGVTGVGVPEDLGGVGMGLVEALTCLHELGRRAVPGPWIESLLVVPLIADDEVVSGVADGSVVATAWLPGCGAGVLDADVADVVFLMAADGSVAVAAGPWDIGALLASIDPVRRLFSVGDDSPTGTGVGGPVPDTAALGCAAMMLGAAEAAIEVARDYAGVRVQFDRPVGSFQAVKHQLADSWKELAFARPLVHGAAVAVERNAHTAARDVSAARVSAERAATRAARVALQVHGAIGYAAENDLSLLLKRIFALRSAWGPADEHRARLTQILREAVPQPWMGPGW